MSAQHAAAPRVVSLPKPAARPASCHACGVTRPASLLLRSPEGPVCDACAVTVDLDDGARAEAWRNLRAGVSLFAITLLLGAASVLASGWIPLVSLDPSLRPLAFSAAAGVAALSSVWGLWAAITGGDRRLALADGWRHTVRGVGAATLLVGLFTGLLVTTLTALGLLV